MWIVQLLYIFSVKLKEICFVGCKVFASTLLSSVKQARAMLRQQRAALCTSTDSFIGSTANEQAQSAADTSQSDLSRLLSQYREAELQVCSQTKSEYVVNGNHFGVAQCNLT